jgi:RNA-directed DNA polymerase
VQARFHSLCRLNLSIPLAESCPNEFDADARKLIARVCCWAPSRTPPLLLCIGAPSSPLLSNSIMYAFDLITSAFVARDGVAYTRYADDLTFSCNLAGVLAKYPDAITRIVDELAYPRLALNTEKTVFASRSGLRMVTGITLTPNYALSIGRDRKRSIRVMYHRYSKGLLDQPEQQKLFGMLAFADSIEPGFSHNLSKKSRS